MVRSSDTIRCVYCHKIIEYLHAQVSDTTGQLVCFSCKDTPSAWRLSTHTKFAEDPFDEYRSPYAILAWNHSRINYLNQKVGRAFSPGNIRQGPSKGAFAAFGLPGSDPGLQEALPSESGGLDEAANSEYEKIGLKTHSQQAYRYKSRLPIAEHPGEVRSSSPQPSTSSGMPELNITNLGISSQLVTRASDFYDSSLIRTPIQIRTSSKFKCAVEGCTKHSKSIRALRGHQYVVHLGKRLYKCDSCNKAFTLSHSLTRHKRTHTK